MFHAQHPMHTLIDEDFMQRVKQQNHVVTAWTVNEPQRARELQAMGVNIIVTDKPGVIRQALIDA
jgi:glycerophosphoryl diester phosphodiesterase